MSNSHFPSNLLQESPQKRLAYFEQYTIAHPRLKETFEKAIKFIGKQGSKASCIAIYGPTGVGKTTMAQKLEKTLIEKLLPTLNNHQSCIPVLSLEAIAPEKGNFDWKDYFTRSLIALEEPLIDYKIDYGEHNIYRNTAGKLVIAKSATASKLRRALENALRYRQPSAVLIDEAQHLQKMTSGRRLQDNMDLIKSLANITKIPHVLIGTYELLNLRNLSGQLSRRTQDIHFPRYRAENKEELEIFINILWTFQEHLPLLQTPDLLNNWQYFYERSLGCVGILKEWLNRALADAIEDNCNTLSLNYLKQRALSIAQCKTMIQSILEGEKQLEETEQEAQVLQDILGLNSQTINSLNISEIGSSKKRKKSVGHRNPVRDKVGS